MTNSFSKMSNLALECVVCYDESVSFTPCEFCGQVCCHDCVIGLRDDRCPICRVPGIKVPLDWFSNETI